MKKIEIKITKELETAVEGTWNAKTGTGEQSVIEAVEMFLIENGYDFDRKDICGYKADGRAMADDCQSYGEWIAEVR